MDSQQTPSRVRGRYRKYLRDANAPIPRSTLHSFRQTKWLQCTSTPKSTTSTPSSVSNAAAALLPTISTSSSLRSHQDVNQTYHSPSQPTSSASQHSQLSTPFQQCQSINSQHQASTSPLQFSSSPPYLTSSSLSSPPNSQLDSFHSSLLSNSHHSSSEVSPLSNLQSSDSMSSMSLLSLSSCSSQAQAIDGSHLPLLQTNSMSTSATGHVVHETNSQSPTDSVHSLSSFPEMPIPPDFPSPHSFSPPSSSSPKSLNSSQHSIPDLASVLNPESISNSPTQNTSQQNYQEYFSPIYPGATITLCAALCAIMQFASSSRLSYAAIGQLLQLLQLLCPKDNNLPTTLYRFRSFFKKFASKHVHTQVCGKCELQVQQCQCAEGDKKLGRLVTVSILKPLRTILSSHWEHLKQCSTQRISTLTDVWDGIALKPLRSAGRFFSTPNHLALCINTDGVPLFKSSSFSLWPVYLVILNLPAKVRANANNIVLVGLWAGPCKPPMKQLLEPVMKTIGSLSTIGMSVMTAAGLQTIRMKLVMGIFDLPAKASALCMKQFNGQFGCSVCLHPGKRLSNNARIFLPEASNHSLRKHSQWVLDADEAVRTSSVVRGITGKSSLMSSLDMVASIPIDYMHAVLEGVVKRLIDLWFNSANHREAFYLGRYTSAIDNMLLQQHPPVEFSRPPRSIKQNLHYWKASELRSWLLFYSLPLLLDFLPSLYWHHYSLLVCGLHILLQKELNIAQIEVAEQLLWDFYELLPELYGEASCTMNAHLLSHLSMYARLWGPLWSQSSFGFESKNGILKHLIHGRNEVTNQLLFNIDVVHTIQLVRPHLEKSETRSTLDFIDAARHALPRSNMTPLSEQPHLYIVGSLSVIQATDEEISVLGTSNPLRVFTRLCKEGIIYYSTRWSRKGKRNDCICSFKVFGSIKFGCIRFFMPSPPRALISMLPPRLPSLSRNAGPPCRSTLVSHQNAEILSNFIVPVETSTRMVQVPISDIINKIVLITTPKGDYVVKQPNNFEHN